MQPVNHHPFSILFIRVILQSYLPYIDAVSIFEKIQLNSDRFVCHTNSGVTAAISVLNPRYQAAPPGRRLDISALEPYQLSASS